MKTILYMEMTVNGYVAGKEDDVSWVSKDAWNSYIQTSKRMDAIIIGKRTYDLMPPEEFHKKPLYVVMTHATEVTKKVSNVLFTADAPKYVMKMLEGKNCKTVCVAGGGVTNSLFLKAGLIDELYLDVEPFVFGKGAPLLSPEEFKIEMQLLETKKLNLNTLQLHYKVLK